VTAERQLEGRGRRGRQWVSESGNLYASLLLIDPAPVAQITTLPLVAALAVHNTLAPFFADRPVAPKIKWPNDILVGDAKISGILLESEKIPGHGLAAVIGCGINCSHHPVLEGLEATDLHECGLEVTAQALFRRLAIAMDDGLRQWDSGRGFALIRRLWLDAARGIGEPVTVNLHDGQMHGIFEDIDEDGHLVLCLPGGAKHLVSAGDLFFEPATGRLR